MKVRLDVAELLRAGATHAEIRQQLGVSYNAIAQARRALNIPVIPRPRPRRPPDDTYHLYATPYGDGHARWDGPWAGRMPQISLHKAHCVSALRVAFRIHIGREPIGPIRRGCDDPACVAGAHLTDQPIRQRLKTTYDAVLKSRRTS